MFKFRPRLAIPLLLLLAAAAAGLGAASGSSSATKRPVAVSTRSVAGLGLILVDSKGRTLYMFVPDKRKKVTCVGTCARIWPPVKLAAGATLVAKGKVKAKLLGSDPDPAGGRVATYHGWPLYTYAGDGKPGEATGQALDLNGGLWYVLSAAGGVIKTKPVEIESRVIPKLGRVLVNSRGFTLYMFAPDKRKHVTCVGTCARVWPPVKLAAGRQAIAGSGVHGNLLGSDADPAGGRVATYHGWPLYAYAGDRTPGQATGQALNLNGGLWYVLSAAGGVVKTKPTTTTSTSSSGNTTTTTSSSTTVTSTATTTPPPGSTTTTSSCPSFPQCAKCY